MLIELKMYSLTTQRLETNIFPPTVMQNLLHQQLYIACIEQQMDFVCDIGAVLTLTRPRQSEIRIEYTPYNSLHGSFLLWRFKQKTYLHKKGFPNYHKFEICYMVFLVFLLTGMKNILKFCSVWEEKINVSMENTFK